MTAGSLARYATALAVTGIAALSGCSGDGSSPGAESSEPLSPLQGLSFDTVAVIGASQGQPWEAFGGIWEVAAAPDGYFAVLDIETTAVHVFDASGAHVGSISDVGLLPGQLRRPTGITWGVAGELLVWDPGSSWISRFSVSPSGVTLVDQRRAFAFGETGFCALGERIYLSYLLNDQVVHEIGPDGAVARSFSPMPAVAGIETIGPDLRDLALEELTPSRLLCTSGRVLEVSYFQSRIRLHDPDGALLWSRDQADFSPVAAYSPDGMGVGLMYADGTGSQLSRSVIPWGEGRVLVQYEVRTSATRPEGRDYEALESRLVQLDSGVEEDRTRELPLFFAAQGNRVYEVRQDPFPQVVVLERRPAN